MRTPIIGRKFGRLTVIGRAERKGFVVCKCDCGNIHTVRVCNLISKYSPTRSCGCYRREASRERIKEVHNKYIKGGTNLAIISNTKLYPNNHSGHTGVYYNQAANRWVAQISFKRKLHHLGSFKTLQEAINARKAAEMELFAPIIDEANGDLAPVV